MIEDALKKRREDERRDVEKALKDMIIKIRAKPIILSEFDMIITADENIWKDYLKLPKHYQYAVDNILKGLIDKKVLILSDYIKEMMVMLEE